MSASAYTRQSSVILSSRSSSHFQATVHRYRVVSYQDHQDGKSTVRITMRTDILHCPLYWPILPPGSSSVCEADAKNEKRAHGLFV